MRYHKTIARVGKVIGAVFLVLVLLAIALKDRQPATVPVGAVPPPADPSPQVVLAFAKVMIKGTQLLNAVQTTQDAEVVQRQLDDLAQEINFNDLYADYKAIEPGKRLELNHELDATYQDWHDHLATQYSRLRAIPGVLEILKDTFPIDFIDKTHVLGTQFSISRLSELAVQFRAKHGNWPPTLHDMVDGKLLYDDWGRPMHYDREGPRHDGQIPDIWSDGPPHYEPDAPPIGNWGKWWERWGKRVERH
jgi:hypothetical protein